MLVGAGAGIDIGVGANIPEPERIASLERRVDQSLTRLKEEVDTTIGAIGSKLDALIAKRAESVS